MGAQVGQFVTLVQGTPNGTLFLPAVVEAVDGKAVTARVVMGGMRITTREDRVIGIGAWQELQEEK